MKPVVVEAVRWRGYSSNLGITGEAADNTDVANAKWEPLPDWLPECKVLPHVGGRIWEAGEIARHGEKLYVGGSTDEMCADLGDWIVRDVDGTIAVWSANKFAETFDMVDE